MASPDLKALDHLLTSTLALLAQFISSLAPPSTTTTTTTTTKDDESATTAPIPNPPNPQNVLHDAAALLKAHTTKLSLLAINKPFTPSAVTKVVRELSSTCLPAMMSAAQIYAHDHRTYGTFVRAEAHARTRRVFREMETLLREVQAIAQEGSSSSGGGGGGGGSAAPARTSARRRDSLASTGVVWESCDALGELAAWGVAGLAVRKAEQWRATIQDAVEELQEWREGTDLDAEGKNDGLLDSEDEGVGGDAESFDDIFNAANSMPKDRPMLTALVETAEGRLKKVVLLYTALIKRRLKTYQTSAANVAVLDQLMVHLKRVPHQIDELASCFYDLDEDRAREMLAKCVNEARDAGKVAALNWQGQEDEFTIWSRKWSDAVG